SPFAAVPALDAAVLDHVYSYGVAAAQTVPIALALADTAVTSARRTPGAEAFGVEQPSVEEFSVERPSVEGLGVERVGAEAFGAGVSAAACLAPVADSAPALTGALLGCAAGYDALPAAWRERVRTLAGCCLPELAGADLLDIAGRLA
ncbi:hypothetical protein ACFPZO_34220, partial [Microbispora camponoti]